MKTLRKPAKKTPKRPPIGHSGASEPVTWVLVGRVSRAIGLDGWIRVQVFSDNPDRFVPGAQFSIQQKGKAELAEVRIDQIRSCNSDTALDVVLEGYPDKASVSQLVCSELFIKAEERFTPGDDRFFPDELTGMDLMSSDGKAEGVVLSLELDVPSPYLQVNSAKYGEVSIPFRKTFLASIDRKKRQVRLAEPIEIHVLDEVRDR